MVMAEFLVVIERVVSVVAKARQASVITIGFGQFKLVKSRNVVSLDIQQIGVSNQ